MTTEMRPTVGGEYVAVLCFTADELRGIADALGHHDAGAQELLSAAADLDSENFFEWGAS